MNNAKAPNNIGDISMTRDIPKKNNKKLMKDLQRYAIAKNRKDNLKYFNPL
jgi:hypothetical protein